MQDHPKGGGASAPSSRKELDPTYAHTVLHRETKCYMAIKPDERKEFHMVDHNSGPWSKYFCDTTRDKTAVHIQ